MAKPTPPTQPGLRVRSCSPMGVIRRAGIAFGPESTDLRLADLSEDAQKRIRAEPLLMVQEIDIAPEADLAAS